MTLLVIKKSCQDFEEILAHTCLLQQYSELPVSQDNLHAH